MKLKIASGLAAIALAAGAVLTGPAAFAAETLTAGGSSFAANILQSCAAYYTKANVTYASVGSSTGRTNFKNGTYDFAASDAAYAAGDEPSGFTYVPLVGGPIAIVFNAGNLTNLRLTPAVLSKILKGSITKWNADAIKRLNPSVTLPNKNITVVYRSDGSGTTQNLANYMIGSGISGWVSNSAWATALGKTPVGTGAAQNQGVVATVQSTAYSIGYSDLADARSKGLSFAALKNPAGEWVKPSVAAAAKFLAAQPVAANGLVTFNYTKKISGAYSASLIAYGLAPTANGTAKGTAIRDFFKYVVNTCAPAKAAARGYVAMSGAIKTKALARIALIK